jgi:transcriptional regulator NrdR family protein
MKDGEIMRCPYCKSEKTKVIDSRETKDGKVRRKRKCFGYGKGFTTYELFEQRLFRLDEVEEKVRKIEDIVKHW